MDGHVLTTPNIPYAHRCHKHGWGKIILNTNLQTTETSAKKPVTTIVVFFVGVVFPCNSRYVVTPIHVDILENALDKCHNPLFVLKLYSELVAVWCSGLLGVPLYTKGTQKL